MRFHQDSHKDSTLAIGLGIQPPVEWDCWCLLNDNIMKWRRYRRVILKKKKLTSPCHSLRERELEAPCAYCHSTCRCFVKFMKSTNAYLYLSCTFCLMSTKFSAEMSRSKYLKNWIKMGKHCIGNIYSESCSVADSKSFWLSSKMADWLFFLR